MKEYGGTVRFERNEPRGTVAVLAFRSPAAIEAGDRAETEWS